MLLAHEPPPPDIVYQILAVSAVTAAVAILLTCLAIIYLKAKQIREAAAADAERQQARTNRQAARKPSEVESQLGLQAAMQTIVDQPADYTTQQHVTYVEGISRTTTLQRQFKGPLDPSADVVIDDRGSPQSLAKWDYDPYAERQGLGPTRARSHDTSNVECEAKIQVHRNYIKDAVSESNRIEREVRQTARQKALAEWTEERRARCLADLGREPGQAFIAASLQASEDAAWQAEIARRLKAHEEQTGKPYCPFQFQDPTLPTPDLPEPGNFQEVTTPATKVSSLL